MKNDRKLFLHDDTGLERERDYLSKGSRMKVYIAVPTSSFSSGSTRYFFVLTSEIECATIGLFFGPEGMCGK